MRHANWHLDVDWLRANHTVIHYFGLGFIQIKLGDWERVHVYTPRLEAIVSEEDVHNHRYNFESTILMGRMTQELFVSRPAEPGARFQYESVSCKEGEDTGGPPIPCSLELQSRHEYAAGSSYYIDHTQLHRIRASSCVTLVQRGKYMKELAGVVSVVGAPKVCPFSRKVPESELWEITAEEMSLGS